MNTAIDAVVRPMPDARKARLRYSRSRSISHYDEVTLRTIELSPLFRCNMMMIIFDKIYFYFTAGYFMPQTYGRSIDSTAVTAF